jgi:hypothetical protein
LIIAFDKELRFGSDLDIRDRPARHVETRVDDRRHAGNKLTEGAITTACLDAPSLVLHVQHLLLSFDGRDKMLGLAEVVEIFVQMVGYPVTET